MSAAEAEGDVQWAKDHPAEDHLLQLQVACKQDVGSRGIYTVEYASGGLVFDDSATRSKVNQRRQIHARSFWKRGQEPPRPNFRHLAEFKECAFIDALLAAAGSPTYLSKPKEASDKAIKQAIDKAIKPASAMSGRSRASRRSTRREPLEDDDDDSTILIENDHGTIVPARKNVQFATASGGGKKSSVKPKGGVVVSYPERINREPVLWMKRGAKTGVNNLLVVVNTAGRASDNSKTNQFAITVIKALLHPEDWFLVRP